MRNKEAELRAEKAAKFVKEAFALSADRKIRIGLVLGTGWGDTLEVNGAQALEMKNIRGFETLGDLSGHARQLVYGRIADKEILVLRGKVHLNETPPSESTIFGAVRLQIEMMLKLGADKLVLTSAVGSLKRHISVGDVVVVDGFVTLFAPAMPLWAGEFCSPEDTLSDELQRIALHSGPAKLKKHSGGYAMVRGPFFEGRKYDKNVLAATGASVVGMSMLPEASIAALYGAEVLGLGFVTNSAFEEHSHEENLNRAKSNSQKLGAILEDIVSKI